MPVENFLVRSKRQLVEKYTDAAAWQQLGIAEQGELIREIAGLPSAISDTDQDAKQFDLLLLRELPNKSAEHPGNEVLEENELLNR